MTALGRVLATAAAVRLVSLAAIPAVYALVPFSTPHHDANFVYPIGEEASLGSAFKTWDANHYLFVAEQGYRPYHISNAFYPLYPFLVRVLAFATFGSELAAGLLLSSALSVAAIGLVFLLVRGTHGEEVAARASLLLLAFPTAFFLGLVYTEALFLTLAAGTLLLVGRGRPGAAALLAALLPLTRPTGILVAIPAGIGLALAWRRGEIRGVLRLALVPAGFLAGLLAYFAVMRLTTGDPLAGFDAQRVFQADNSLARLLHPVDWFAANFVHVDWTLHGFRTSVLNRLCFVLFVAATALTWRRLPPDLLAASLALGLVPAMTGSLTSYPRYVLAAFPLFVSLALLLRGRVSFRIGVAASAAVQALAFAVHVTNRWVA